MEGLFLENSHPLIFNQASIFPFDRDIFSDLEFLPSDVTDRFVPSAGTENLTQSKHQLFNEQPQVSERPSSSTNQSLLNVTSENIRPLTKAAPRKRKSCTNRGKTKILTDTPKKNQIITNAEKKKTTQKICKRIITASIESGSEEASSLLFLEEGIVRIIAQPRTKNCPRSPNLAKSKKKNLPWSDCVQKKVYDIMSDK